MLLSSITLFEMSICICCTRTHESDENDLNASHKKAGQATLRQMEAFADHVPVVRQAAQQSLGTRVANLVACVVKAQPRNTSALAQHCNQQQHATRAQRCNKRNATDEGRRGPRRQYRVSVTFFGIRFSAIHLACILRTARSRKTAASAKGQG